jgi:hypothetical protein
MRTTDKKTYTFTCDCLQKSGDENHVSSTTTSEFNGFPLYVTALMEDVTTVLLTE